MDQVVNLARKIAVWNVGCVFVYFCGGHKNNFPIWFRSSFKENLSVKPVNPKMAFFEISGGKLNLSSKDNPDNIYWFLNCLVYGIHKINVLNFRPLVYQRSKVTSQLFRKILNSYWKFLTYVFSELTSGYILNIFAVKVCFSKKGYYN